MENSDLITRTSYGKNNGENTITSIEWVTQVYKHNKWDINMVRIAHMYQFGFRKVPFRRKTEKKKTNLESIFNRNGLGW